MIGNTIVFAVVGIAPWSSEAELVYRCIRKYPEGLARIVGSLDDTADYLIVGSGDVGDAKKQARRMGIHVVSLKGFEKMTAGFENRPWLTKSSANPVQPVLAGEESEAGEWKMAFRVALDIMTSEQRAAFSRLWRLEYNLKPKSDSAGEPVGSS